MFDKQIVRCVALLGAATIFLAACDLVQPPQEVTGVTISGPDTVAVGATIELTAEVTGPDDPSQEVTWSSSDEAVATIDADGVVTGVAEGSATITATSVEDPDVSADHQVTVTEEEAAVVVSGPNAVVIGQTIQLTAEVEGPGDPSQEVTWSSSDEAVATVDADGVVTGVAEGSATITATSVQDPDVSGDHAVTVREELPTVHVDAAADPGGDGSPEEPFQTIQQGIDAITDEGTVIVAAGTYDDAVSVTKSLTLQGANEGIDPNTGTRDAESVISGQISIDTNDIDAVIDGFEITTTTTPAIGDSATGYNLEITNTHFSEGVRRINLSDPASLTFTNNRLTDYGQSGAGFLFISGDYDGAQGTTTTVTDNVFANFPSSPSSPVIHLNSVTGTVANNEIDMSEIVAGQDNTRIAVLLAGTIGDLVIDNNHLTNANQGIRFFSISADGLGPVTIDNNTFSSLRQGIVADDGGDLNSVNVTNNTFTNLEEGIRIGQTGLSVTTNSFEGASDAYIIDASEDYDLNDILTNNTYDPPAEISTFDGHPAIIEQ